MCSPPNIFDDVLDAPSVPQKPIHSGDGSTASDLCSVNLILPSGTSDCSQTPPFTYHSLPPAPSPVVADDNSSNSCDPLDLIQAGAASTPVPTSFRQSQQHPDADLWQKACKEEMEAHRLNSTWEIVKVGL